jgi:hypothetical protein
METVLQADEWCTKVYSPAIFQYSLATSGEAKKKVEILVFFKRL